MSPAVLVGSGWDTYAAARDAAQRWRVKCADCGTTLRESEATLGVDGRWACRDQQFCADRRPIHPRTMFGLVYDTVTPIDRAIIVRFSWEAHVALMDSSVVLARLLFWWWP